MRWTGNTIPLMNISIQTEDRWGNRTTEAKELSVTLGTFENMAATVMEKIGDEQYRGSGRGEYQTIYAFGLLHRPQPFRRRRAGLYGKQQQ